MTTTVIPMSEGEVTALREQIDLGQWYWVNATDRDDKPYRWLGCVMKIGSNFVEVHSVGGGYKRVHDDDLTEILTPEPDPQAVIDRRMDELSAESKALMDEMHDLTRTLGVAKTPALPDRQTGNGQELAVLSGTSDTDAYKQALTKAKKTLPEIEEKLRRVNERLTDWMKAGLMPLRAQQLDMRSTMEAIDSRIFNVSLYAGLGEDVVLCRDGDTAPADEKLRVFQLRRYMDEEALLNYEAGGMDFRNIEAFDEWLCRDENRDRILPFPRCMVAMRVRRNPKDYDADGSPVLSAFVQMEYERQNKVTYLYLRNGERVYRLNIALELGELIFPDRAEFDPSQGMMAAVSGDVREVISRAEFDVIKAEHDEAQVKYEAWAEANPDKSWIENPHRHNHSFRESEWHPFDRTSVYFDDIAAYLGKAFERYNRLALLIQGIFDRSVALHPHPKVEVWNSASFSESIELIYDSERALYAGEKPDFEAYRARLNASLAEGSLTVGQDDVWEVREADREYNRQLNDWRIRDARHPGRLRPYGDPGPGLVAQVSRWMPRARRATFVWHRASRSNSWDAPDRVRETLTVEAKDLLNVSAYRPGDFRQFFFDPRTRAEYLKWAPLLLAAEDYWAGKLGDES